MTLGEMYQKYRMILYRYKGRPITAHKVYNHHVSFDLWQESHYEMPWDTLVEVRDNKFFINGNQVRFCVKVTELTPEMLIQADMTGGYIPVDISNHSDISK